MGFLDEFDIDGVLSAADKTLEQKPKQHENWFKNSKNFKPAKKSKPYWATITQINMDGSYTAETMSKKVLNHIFVNEKLEKLLSGFQLEIGYKIKIDNYEIIDYEIPANEYDEIDQEELDRLEEEYNNLGGMY